MKTYFLTVLIFVGISVKFATAQQKLKSAKPIRVDNAFEKGVTQNGYKTGNWQYFDRPGTLSLTVDYTAGKILFQKKDTVGLYAIEKSGLWIQSNLNVRPRYIGSMGEFYRILMSNIRYPYEARNKSTVGTVYVTFDVDTNGKAVNYNIVKNIGDNCADFKQIIDHVRDTDYIYLFGPSDAKYELKNAIEKEGSKCKVIAVESADKMTVNQMQEKSKSYFESLSFEDAKRRILNEKG